MMIHVVHLGHGIFLLVHLAVLFSLLAKSVFGRGLKLRERGTSEKKTVYTSVVAGVCKPQLVSF